MLPLIYHAAPLAAPKSAGIPASKACKQASLPWDRAYAAAVSAMFPGPQQSGSAQAMQENATACVMLQASYAFLLPV